ncbi:MAG: porin [Pseudomonadota bacterium]
MQTKKIIALTSLATLAGASWAQSPSEVRLYGAIDAGLAFIDNGAKSGSHTTAITSGVARPSSFGFAGTEDLGNGMKAEFRLEAGFDSDTGAMKNYAGNPGSATPAAPGGATVTGLFNRRAYVGLSGKFGTLSLGRDYTPVYWAALDSDALGLTFYGNLQESVVLSGTGSDRFGRVSNALFYLSPTIGGFTARALVSLGSESGGAPGTPPSKANRMLAASGKYAWNGFMVTAVYQQIDLPKVAGTPAAFTGATGTRKDLVIGTRYSFGDWSVSTGGMRVQQPTVADTDGSQLWLGGTVQIGSGTVHANVQRLRQHMAAGPAQVADVYSLAYLYPLSKRTALYASYGQVDNGTNGAFPLVSADPSIAPGAAGATVKALALGIRHTF